MKSTDTSSLMNDSNVFTNQKQPFKKFTKEERLISIFKIYNRKDMIDKIGEMKKGKEQHRSVNDYDYETPLQAKSVKGHNLSMQINHVQKQNNDLSKDLNIYPYSWL